MGANRKNAQKQVQAFPEDDVKFPWREVKPSRHHTLSPNLYLTPKSVKRELLPS